MAEQTLTETKAAYTPGPWITVDDATFSSLGDKRIVGADRISPAIVFGGIMETLANASLIAAAPTMLETLRLITHESLSGAPYAVDRIRGLANDAIATAEGR